MKERTSYQSCVALSNMSDVSEILSATFSPVSCKVPPDYISVKVCHDIETSVHKEWDIVQLAAVYGEDIFNKYILPSQSSSKAASNVTGKSCW